MIAAHRVAHHSVIDIAHFKLSACVSYGFVFFENWCIFPTLTGYTHSWESEFKFSRKKPADPGKFSELWSFTCWTRWLHGSLFRNTLGYVCTNFVLWFIIIIFQDHWFLTTFTMKFSKRLQELAHPSYLHYYLNYSELKRVAKLIKTEVDNVEHLTVEEVTKLQGSGTSLSWIINLFLQLFPMGLRWRAQSIGTSQAQGVLRHVVFQWSGHVFKMHRDIFRQDCISYQNRTPAGILCR